MATKLLQGLSRVPELKSVKAEDLTKLSWNTKQTILTVLVCKLVPESKLAYIVDAHERNVASNKSSGIKPNTHGFRTAFSKAALHDVKALGDAPVYSYQDIMSDAKRSEFLQLIRWLLERVQSRNRREARSKSPFGGSRTLDTDARDAPTSSSSSPASIRKGLAPSSPSTKEKQMPAREIVSKIKRDQGSGNVAKQVKKAKPKTTASKYGKATTNSHPLKSGILEADSVTSYEQLRAVYDQLVSEASSENYDKRRLNLLKAQNIQLERQVLLLNQTLDSRSDAIQAVENMVLEVDNITSQKTTKDSAIGSALMRAVSQSKKLLEKARECASDDRSRLPFFFSSRYTHSDPLLVDICRGSAVSIDAAKLSELETSLADLCRQLHEVQPIIGALGLKNLSTRTTFKSGNEELVQTLAGGLDKAIHDLTDSVQHTAHEVLSLMVMLPMVGSANLGHRRTTKSWCNDLPSSTEILSRFPAQMRKKKEVQELVEQFTNAAQRVFEECYSLNSQLQSELDVHWKIHAAHIDYANALCHELQKVEKLKNAEFEGRSSLKEILTAFNKMKETNGEAELLSFLATFKNSVESLQKLDAQITNTEKEGHDTVKEVFCRAADLSAEFSTELEKLESEMRMPPTTTEESSPLPFQF